MDVHAENDNAAITNMVRYVFIFISFKDIKMKTYLTILVIAALSFSACTSIKDSTSAKYSDDVYYSSKDAAADKEKQRLADEKQRADDEKAAQEEAEYAAQNKKN